VAISHAKAEFQTYVAAVRGDQATTSPVRQP